MTVRCFEVLPFGQDDDLSMTALHSVGRIHNPNHTFPFFQKPSSGPVGMWIARSALSKWLWTSRRLVQGPVGKHEVFVHQDRQARHIHRTLLSHSFMSPHLFSMHHSLRHINSDSRSHSPAFQHQHTKKFSPQSIFLLPFSSQYHTFVWLLNISLIPGGCT